MSQIVILQKVAISIIIIFFGYAVKKMKFLPAETGKVLNSFIIYITLPASIAKVFLTTKVNTNLFVLTLSGFAFGFITFIIGFLAFRNANLKRETKGTLIISLCGYNIGLFAFPFVQQIYGNNGLLHIAMFDMGNSFNVFGVAYIAAYAFSQSDKLDLKKVFKKILCFVPFDTYEYFRQLLLPDISEFQETSFKFIPQNFILKSFFDFQFIYIFIYIVRFFLYISLYLTYMVAFYLDFFKSPQ
ncbi:AEC family transporter [Thermoanaerobacterium aotearoense]|uniref:AEC family transporter n=2 Tax=Thermoanaerobacterium aotearoense TaxID=47490 RepID=UPI001EFF9410|nr:AEC family transporter [Thermoanaerobacterium aotearoense]